MKMNIMKNIKEFIRPENIEFFLANTPQITFEVTDACNLNCTYCGYGDLYSDYDTRENKKLPLKKAIKLLDYLNRLWHSSMNLSYNKNVCISFYGGEPLININFIRQVVEYVEKLDCPTRSFSFDMTTNATLLSKNMDFLVKHNFHILISLDGDRENTAYRVDKKGNPTFNKIINNVDILKERYPDYFKIFVNFNAVLHNKNSVESIYLFFKTKYNKVPRISELNNMGIREDKRDEFKKTYQDISESLYQSEHYTEIMKEMSSQLGTTKSLGTFLLRYSKFVYQNYNELIYGKPKKIKMIPTGTCLPFAKKIFMTVNGKLLPCERIGQQFALGVVTKDGIELDFKAIANKYNYYYAKIDKQCKTCQNKKTCIQCIYNLPELDKNPVCHGYMSHEDFENYKFTLLNFLANNPEEYYNIMNNLIIY